MRTFAPALVVAFSLTLIAVSGCGGGKATGRDLSEDAKQLVAGNNAFAFELYGRLKGTDRNLFFSPYCTSECLAMTYAGARGDTEKQIRRVLHFPTNGTHSAFARLRRGLKQASGRKGIELNIANGIWAQTKQALLPAYADLLRRDYEAEVRQVNFATDAGPITEEINAWANTKTSGKIPKVVPPGLLDRLSRQLLERNLLQRHLEHEVRAGAHKRVGVPSGDQRVGKVPDDAYQREVPRLQQS